jgi:hypothetical protein
MGSFRKNGGRAPDVRQIATRPGSVNRKHRRKYSKQKPLLPRIHETKPFPEIWTQAERNLRLPWRSSALERLQGKERLHGLAPKTPS